MNRDTLYAGIPIDTSQGYSITVPEHPDDRYMSVYVLDNEHMTLQILRGSSVKHTFDQQENTRYVVAIPRVQLLDQADPADAAETLAILRSVKVESGSAEPKPMVNWDWEGMFRLRGSYEDDFKCVEQIASDRHYGGPAARGDERPNRLDITEGWNILLRVYRPGRSVIDGDEARRLALERFIDYYG